MSPPHQARLDPAGGVFGGRFVAPVVATGSLGALFLPWLETGSTRRSAFRVVAALRGAGLMSRTPAQIFFAAIALLPGTVAAAWLLATARLPRLAAVATAAAGLLTTGTALTVRHVAHHRAATGTSVAIVAGLVAASVGFLVIGAGTARPALESDHDRA